MLTSILLSLALSSTPALAEPAAASTAAEGSSDRWEQTVDRVSKAVVALRVTGTRDFDTESARSSVGTGFVVDAERGLILTNRHMVHAGPVVAEAVFLDHTEVELEPIYRDPVHDFGLYRFDPKDVKYMDLVELELAPEAARVGMEIRVVGNDAGEKISILDGTLARLDRSAPNYGGNTYNDFNTFYLQAASGTSGGSSGSPVVDVDGRVIALNAGGSRQAASSFYLPLDRVVRALELIQDGEPVTRGTIQTVFVHQPFDEVGRLGLTDDTEATVRRAFPEGTGMLVVDQTVPGGPGAGLLQPGDVLVRVNGELVTGFVPLEDVLDRSVGKAVTLEIERGGEPLTVEVPVGDLHAITPDEYLEVGRAVLHTLSYHQARNHHLPVQGVYVAVPGYMLARAGIRAGTVVTEIDGEPVPDLDALQRVLEQKPDGARVQWRYRFVSDPHQDRVAMVTMDRTWHPMQRCLRDDTTGEWPCTPAAPAPATVAPEPATTSIYASGSKAARRLAPSLVMVDFDIPYPTAGVKDFNYVGAGVVVDAERGVVVVDRDTVPVSLGDMMLTFGGTVRIPAELAYLHPVHNFALLRYDPALLGDTPVQAANLVEADVSEGDTLRQVAIGRTYELVDTEVTVERYDTTHFGASRTPRFRDANMQAVHVDGAASSMGGVLANKRGDVVALWASFLDQASGDRSFQGLPAHYVKPLVDRVLTGQEPVYRWIGAEFLPVPLADARELGLSDARAEALLAHDPKGRKVLQVVRISGGTDAEQQLREGDLLLAVNGRTLTRVGEVEQAYDPYEHDAVELTLLRDGEERTIELATQPLGGEGVDRIVSWAGLILHEPHFEARTQRGVPDDGVYVAWLWYGSPAAKYGLRPTRRIVEVDGRPTPDLDSLLDVVSEMRDRQAVRITSIALDGEPSVDTLKLDLDYWPTQILERDGAGWTRVGLDEASTARAGD